MPRRWGGSDRCSAPSSTATGCRHRWLSRAAMSSCSTPTACSTPAAPTGASKKRGARRPWPEQRARPRRSSEFVRPSRTSRATSRTMTSPSSRSRSCEQLGGGAADQRRLGLEARQRVAESLCDRAAERYEFGGLLCRLDALGDHVEVERVRHAHDRRDDRSVVVAPPESLYEAAVDLQRVDREALEVAQ